MAESTDKRFKITHGSEADCFELAEKVAKELESRFKGETLLVTGESGAFEVEDKGILIYSKKATGRLPDDGEVAKIVQGVADGMTLEEAQSVAGPPASAILEWIFGLFRAPTEH